MINKFSLCKSLRDRLKISTDLMGVSLVGFGEISDPAPDTAYVEEIVLFGEDRQIGLSNNSSQIQKGIFQVNINVPKKDGKWIGLNHADLISANFAVGTVVSHGGQDTRITEIALAPLMKNATHLIFILSFTYSVIN